MGKQKEEKKIRVSITKRVGHGLAETDLPLRFVGYKQWRWTQPGERVLGQVLGSSGGVMRVGYAGAFLPGDFLEGDRCYLVTEADAQGFTMEETEWRPKTRTPEHESRVWASACDHDWDRNHPAVYLCWHCGHQMVP